MILLDKDIKYGLSQGDIVIDEFIPENLGPNSYDVRLDDRLLVYTHRELDMRINNSTRPIIIPKDGYVLQPGELYLGSTIERFGTKKNYVAHITGRSSIARLGMGVHITAGFGDMGFIGNWTLEITVVRPLRVYAGDRIAQAYFETGKSSESLKTYNGKYVNQNGAVQSFKWADGDVKND